MSQDGKLEQRTDTEPASNAPVISPGGKVLLTLCTSPDDAAPYQHATIPFPSSYQAACTAALEVFAAYIPPDVEAVSLRQATIRVDGQRVWSIVPEHNWDMCLERRGEEIGIFLPDMAPENIPYRKVQRPKKIVYFQHTYGTVKLVPRAVNSLADCVKCTNKLSIEHKWDLVILYYDERMMGPEADQELYRSRINTHDKRPKWRELHDAETFDVLCNLLPEPLWINIEAW